MHFHGRTLIRQPPDAVFDSVAVEGSQDLLASRSPVAATEPAAALYAVRVR